MEGVVRVAVVVGSSPGPGEQHLDARALQDRQDGGRHFAELVLVRVEVEKRHLEPWQQERVLLKSPEGFQVVVEEIIILQRVQ